MRKIVQTLGVVRATVIAVTMIAVAVAGHKAGLPPLIVFAACVGIGGVCWLAPFGAKYRRHY